MRRRTKTIGPATVDIHGWFVRVQLKEPLLPLWLTPELASELGHTLNSFALDVAAERRKHLTEKPKPKKGAK